MHYVIAYDVVSSRRRTKIMNALKNRGLRVQYSVFECELDRQRLEELKSELRGLLNLRTDSLKVYPLCEKCFFQAESMGVEK